jgi:CheY-like chemotaxis protein
MPPAPPEPERGRVLVSTDGVEFQSMIGEVLAAAGFTLRYARSGDEAWAAIGSWRPRVVLLDVALPGIPAFELCDRVRADKGLAGTGLILIASVFQQTRYKRAPTSLYGADDYIEKHHIRDWLPEKVQRLMGSDAAAAGPDVVTQAPAAAAHAAHAAHAEGRHVATEERDQETLIREEVYGTQSRERQGLHRLQESLRRYARIIISDIALYNQELVERGIREGTFSELLKKEIEEGFRLYQLRVPSSTGGEEYYHEAVRDFIARRTGAAGAGGAAPKGKR